jgi:hypothetical protein
VMQCLIETQLVAEHHPPEQGVAGKSDQSPKVFTGALLPHAAIMAQEEIP